MPMQFKITLHCQDENPTIPINYQYELSAWIYKVIHHADAEYSTFLHKHGHQTPSRKSFKLFCFSQLDVPRRRIEADRLIIESRDISFIIGFYLDRTAEEFVRGLFMQQNLRLGDRVSQARFVVQSVEAIPIILSNGPEPVPIRMRSPLVISRKRLDAQDEYLHPTAPDFGKFLFINLIDKYTAATGYPLPSWWDSSRFSFRPLGQEPRSKLIKIKSDTDAQTKVKGYLFDFELDAPRELVEVGLLAGFGRMNGEGFGCGGIAPLVSPHEGLSRKTLPEKTLAKTRG